MIDLHVSVNNKIATYQKRDGDIVCGNSDYRIKFTFDEEWEGYENKTARFVWNGQFQDVEFTGDTCPVPILSGVTLCEVGVYAGELCTTTSAFIGCKTSILCQPASPSVENDKYYANEARKYAEEAKTYAEDAQESGATFTPSVSADGTLSWTNDKDLENPPPVNIKGEKGDTGEQGIQGIQGPQGEQGPQGDTYTLTEADKTEIAQAVIESLGGSPIFGIVDENNNIIVSGNLADGTYSVKYEMEDGSTIDIGELAISSAEPTEPKNFAVPTDDDWQEGYRLTTDGNTLKALSGSIVTNYVAVKVGDTILVEGIDFVDSNNRQAILGSDKEAYTLAAASGFVGAAWAIDLTYDDNSFQITLGDDLQYTDMYMRFSGMPTGASEDVVINIKRNGEWLTA